MGIQTLSLKIKLLSISAKKLCQHILQYFFDALKKNVKKLLTCRVLGGKFLQLGVDGGGGGVLQQRLLGLGLVLGVDHGHVDVDGVDPGDAEADPQLAALQQVTLHLLLCHLR